MNELTDAQIDALLVAHGKGDDGFHAFARAVIDTDRAQRQAEPKADLRPDPNAYPVPAQRQAVQEPYGWQVAGTRELYHGDYAELDARASAKRIGGTCTAFPLYTAAPKPTQVPLTLYIPKDKLAYLSENAGKRVAATVFTQPQDGWEWAAVSVTALPDAPR